MAFSLLDRVINSGEPTLCAGWTSGSLETISTHTYNFFGGMKEKKTTTITTTRLVVVRIALDGRLSSFVPRENQGGRGDSSISFFSPSLCILFLAREKGGEK